MWEIIGWWNETWVKINKPQKTIEAKKELLWDTKEKTLVLLSEIINMHVDRLAWIKWKFELSNDGNVIEFNKWVEPTVFDDYEILDILDYNIFTEATILCFESKWITRQEIVKMLNNRLEEVQEYQYEVQDEDTLYGIVKRHYSDLSWEALELKILEIAKYNGISNPEIIWPPQTIKFPDKVKRLNK